MSGPSRHWRINLKELLGEQCPECRAKMYPPRDVCIVCGREVVARLPHTGVGAYQNYLKNRTKLSGVRIE